ncbi:MAG: VWA-like domain-containing protein [Anaerovoracaceae bacterium]|nr:VWA-like domain-containing protein [Bacillota bacterium]MDY2670462.1 VWA-like domain-containing protein [Anaerovoracaceae bacterium]
MTEKVKPEELAAEILELSGNTLRINLRFLEKAFLPFRSVTGEDVTEMTATDGTYLYYSAPFIIRTYQKNENLVTRNYLHTIFHCLYQHMFVSADIDRQLWNLSCDIQVEYQISQLGIQSLYAGREEQQAWILKELEEDLPGITAERIYRYYKDKNLRPAEISNLRQAFLADDHNLWLSYTDDSESAVKGDMKSEAGNDSEESENEMQQDEISEEMEETDGSADNNDDAGSGNSKSSSENGDDQRKKEKESLPAPDDVKRKWKEIAQRVEVDLTTFNESYGSGTGAIIQTLRRINRERYDYAEFLRKFSAMGENVELNDDEFDYIFYTYGMQLYDNMPLIEPLEYREVKKIRDFVIAIDTSESVAGDLVQMFVQKTWNILKQTNNFFSRVNIHIMECSASVTSDVLITTDEEFEQYIKNMTLLGFGGTDFRPVFERVDELIRQHEFSDLKGIIYFTDGYGTFPAAAPQYESCFVFIDEGREIPDVPPWAMKLVLEASDIRKM